MTAVPNVRYWGPTPQQPALQTRAESARIFPLEEHEGGNHEGGERWWTGTDSDNPARGDVEGHGLTVVGPAESPIHRSVQVGRQLKGQVAESAANHNSVAVSAYGIRRVSLDRRG